MIAVPYKIVWIAGMPRSGSMWAYNVARTLLRAAGRNVFPDAIPKSDPQMVEAARAGMADRSPGNVWCLKVHSVLRNAAPNNRFINTVRDPRDAVVSLMRFTHCDFEYALVSASIWTKVSDYYRALPPETCLRLDYDAIALAPEDSAARMTQFLGLDLTPESITGAVTDFEREKIRRRLDDLRDELQRRTDGDSASPDLQIANADGSLRLWDPQTGFQAGHVSDYQPGDWRKMLTGEQKRRLDETIGDWLSYRGYDRRLDP